ncbi:cytochrome P450, partial [Cynara cardunculus var. scolymus]
MLNTPINCLKLLISKYGKVFRTRLMGSPSVVVHGPAANKFFMSNEFKLVVSSWPTSSVEFMRDSHQWRNKEAPIVTFVEASPPPSAIPASRLRGEITEEEVVVNAVLLVFAAHDTTSYAITMTFKMLADHPDCEGLTFEENGVYMASSS